MKHESMKKSTSIKMSGQDIFYPGKIEDLPFVRKLTLFDKFFRER